LTSRVLVVGAAGQVGRALRLAAPAGVELHAVTHAELDIGAAAQVANFVAELEPTVIINAAAYTAVDKAETEPEAAARVNAEGVRNLANALLPLAQARLIHISTDFVFDGRSSSPYRTDDRTNPLSVYGATKLAGERAALDVLGERATVVRTAWVYAAQGKSFLTTMLRLMKERGAVRVVSDQVGTPTAAGPFAEALWLFAQRSDLSGLFHWTDAGVASWYDFAVAIAEEGAACGLLPEGVTVTPIATHEYPTPAKRPAYSVLDKLTTASALGAQPAHWRVRLRSVIKELAGA
jgi:dTDP-4-dehydrorhamnose reductase